LFFRIKPMATSPRGTKAGRPKTRSKTLRQAASLVFAVTAILPLLLFVWTVYYLGALSRLSAQVGLGVALATSLMGYYVFRGLIGQMSDLIAVIGKVLERSPAGPRASAEPLEGTSEESGEAWATLSSAPTEPPRLRRSADPASPARAERLDAPQRPARDPAPQPASRPADAHTVPGFGAIREVHDLRRATALLWQAEAAAYKGRRVVVSVMNSPRPITGTLTELTEEGLLIQLEGGERVVAAYNRISSIDAEDSPA
jgi:hypothetical protein